MLSEEDERRMVTGPGRVHHPSGRNRKFGGILGWPLEHTLSPAIHNAAFRAVGMDWIYLAFPVPPELLGSAVAGLRALGASGANVTMPHKASVMDFLDDVSGDARAVGAVNTIANVKDRLIGHNTDVGGFREFLAGDAGFQAAGKTALVLGSGGAARAVVRALDELDIDSITIAAREQERGAALMEIAGSGGDPRHDQCKGGGVGWVDAGSLAGEADLFVNATPLGMRREDPIPTARFRAGQFVVDLIYDPPTTPMVERARQAGADAWGGLGMLVHQAAASFQIWTGQDPPLETMSAAAVRGLGAHGRSG
jgi:shikimate dehydrogenase